MAPRPADGVGLHLLREMQVSLGRHQTLAGTPVVGIPATLGRDPALVAVEVATVPAMDLGVEPKGGGVLAAAGHGDQGRDALGPPENRPNRSVELGLGMDGEMPSVAGGTGQRRDERDPRRG